MHKKTSSYKMKVLLIGVGPTCIGFLYRFKEICIIHPELKDVVIEVIEKEDHCGGLSSSVEINGCTLDYGGHVFYSHYKYFTRILEEYEVKGMLKKKTRKAMIYFDSMIPFPFQSNIHLLQKSTALMMIDDLRKRDTEATVGNLEEWGMKQFGTSIYERFFRPQNQKSLSSDLKDVGTYWVSDRIFVPDPDTIEELLLEDKPRELKIDWGPNSSFYIPTSGGTMSIWKDILSHLDVDVEYNTKCVFVNHDENNETQYFVIDHEGKLNIRKCDIVVSSMPLDYAISKSSHCFEIDDMKLSIVSNKLMVIGVCISLPLPDVLTDVTWIYIPNKKYLAYRASVLTNYSEDNSPPGTYLLLFEISVRGKIKFSTGDAKENCVMWLLDSGIIKSEDEITDIVSPPELVLNYPIPTINRNEVLNDTLRFLEDYEMYQRGRFGAWKYEVGNMDHSFMQGVELCNRLFNKGIEVTIHDDKAVNSGNGNIIDHIVSISE